VQRINPALLKRITRIISIAVTAVLAVLLIANVYTIIARAATGKQNTTFFGFSSAVVITGSMSGTIEVNDLIICREQRDYNVGDIVTYTTPGGSLVTHRIVSESDLGFITRGDANNTPDSQPVSPESIVGRVVCTIPGIGLFIEYLRTPLGLACVVLVGLLLLALPSVMDRTEESASGSGSEKDHFPKNGGNKNGTENKRS